MRWVGYSVIETNHYGEANEADVTTWKDRWEMRHYEKNEEPTHVGADMISDLVAANVARRLVSSCYVSDDGFIEPIGYPGCRVHHPCHRRSCLGNPLVALISGIQLR